MLKLLAFRDDFQGEGGGGGGIIKIVILAPLFYWYTKDFIFIRSGLHSFTHFSILLSGRVGGVAIM